MDRVRPWVPVVRPDTVPEAHGPWAPAVRARWDPAVLAVPVHPWVPEGRVARARRWDREVLGGTAPARGAQGPIRPARAVPVRWVRVVPVVRVRWAQAAQVDPVRWVRVALVATAPAARARWDRVARVQGAPVVLVRWDLVVPAVRVPVGLVPARVPVRGDREVQAAPPACR